MRALVTGSHGFIGSNLVKRLKDEGHEVFEYDLWHDQNVLSLEGASNATLDVVYHLACMNQMEATTNGYDNILVNGYGAKIMADYAKDSGAKIIYTSTASVYGAQPDFNIPTSTFHYVNPQSDYAIAKLAGEWFVRNSGADYTILRLSNVYGPGQTVDNPYCGVVGRFFDQALKGEPLTIIGDGSQTRDFTYVDDVVDWLVTCAQIPIGSGPLNISRGKETNIHTLAKMILMEMGETLYGSRFDFVEGRPVDGIKRRCLLPDLHCPTDLTTGLKRTLEWLSAGHQATDTDSLSV